LLADGRSANLQVPSVLLAYHRLIKEGGDMARMSLTVVAALILAYGSALYAHHGYANFYLDQSKSIEGELESVLFGNPHVILTIRGTDSTVYTVTWRTPAQVKRAG
jgi:hypothetical protein